MKRKKVIQGVGIVMMIIGLLTCLFSLGWQFGLFDGILPPATPKVYDWSEMQSDVNRENAEEVEEPVTDEIPEDVTTSTESTEEKDAEKTDASQETKNESQEENSADSSQRSE